MKLIPTLCAVVVVGLTSTPAFALFCTNTGPDAGFTISSDGGGRRLRHDSNAQKEFDLARLRGVGVYANSVERWNGCLRAFVPSESGGENMQFYDPATLRRLQ